MKISITEKETCSVIQPMEEVYLYNSTEFKKYIASTLEKNRAHIIIDLTNIQSADSSLISSLIFASKKAESVGKKCFLINVTNDVLKILRISNIESMFVICGDESECMNKFFSSF